jgi:NADH dehydrogenase
VATNNLKPLRVESLPVSRQDEPHEQQKKNHVGSIAGAQARAIGEGRADSLPVDRPAHSAVLLPRAEVNRQGPIEMSIPSEPGGPVRVLVLGGGFAGVHAAWHLQRLRRKSSRPIEITLVNRDNYFLMTPLLFEAGSGVLEPRHAVQPIRTLLQHCRFVEADVEHIDVDQQCVLVRHAPGFDPWELRYDHLVVAMGGVTNTAIIPGSEKAMTFKTLADAIYLRNHIIDLFERADVDVDAERRDALLRFVIIGAGLVGVELMGELTEFVGQLSRSYPRVERRHISFHLLEAGPKILPEMERDLADYAAERLRKRGVDVRVDSPARAIDENAVHLPDGTQLTAATIVLAAGVAVNPLVRALPLEKDRKGRIQTDSAMLARGRTTVWALGDCASIPDPEGKPYPQLAQHALREARVVAQNIVAAVNGRPTKPFVYNTLGTLAALGHYDGVGRVWKFKIRGFVAWFAWRTYYLFQMPRWERRIRIMMDWTVALLFKNDVVKLDLFGQEHPLRAHDLRPHKAREQEAA